MENRIETGLLFDFYGPLLTKRQQTLLRLWCEEDLSLSEIAQQENISRQGVCDTVHTAQLRLADYEEKLGMLRRHLDLTNGLRECLVLLQGGREESAERAAERLRTLLAQEEEDGL